MELVSTTGPLGAWLVGSFSMLTVTLVAWLVGESGMGMATWPRALGTKWTQPTVRPSTLAQSR